MAKSNSILGVCLKTLINASYKSTKSCTALRELMLFDLECNHPLRGSISILRLYKISKLFLLLQQN